MKFSDLCRRTHECLLGTGTLQMAPGGGAAGNVEGLAVRHDRRKLGHILSEGECVSFVDEGTRGKKLPRNRGKAF